MNKQAKLERLEFFHLITNLSPVRVLCIPLIIRTVSGVLLCGVASGNSTVHS